MILSWLKLQNILKILGNDITRTSDKDNTEQYYLQPYVTLWERFMLLKNTHLITILSHTGYCNKGSLIKSIKSI